MSLFEGALLSCSLLKMRPTYLYMSCLLLLLFAGSSARAQKAVGDTLQYTIMAGGSVTVPEGEEWRFLSLTYSEGMYGMAVAWAGPDTLKDKYTWVAPFWSVESQLLGDGKSTGMYSLKVIKIKMK
jgi:hypothetical protein